MRMIEEYPGEAKTMALVYAVLLLVCLGALWWTLSDTQSDMEREQARYCRMVQAGSWPDFKHTYEESCK